MYSRTRKPSEQSFNGNIQDESVATTSTNFLNTTTTTTITAPSTITSSTINTNTIPPNKGGKRYTMNEVFQVWYDNKDEILNPKFELPVKHYENYKLSKPSQIYHLDLNPEGRMDLEPVTQQDQDDLVNNQDQLPIDENSQPVQGQISKSLDQLTINESSQSPAGTNTVVASSFVDQTISNIVQGGPPPGISQQQQQLPPPVQSLTPPLITSDKIEWYYIDPHGTEQGPFNGDLMQEWLSGGYLNLDLQIRRKEESTYRTVQQLCDSVQNYVQPFKVPLIDLNAPPPPSQSSLIQPPFSHLPKQQSQFQQFLTGNSRLTNPQSSLFGNDFINNDPFGTTNPLSQSTFQNPTTSSNQFGIDTINQHHHHQTFANPLQSILQQQVQQPSLSRNNSGWGSSGLDTSGGFGSSNPATPVTSTLPQISQPTPLSPWITGIPSSSRTNSPFVPSSTINGATNATVPISTTLESDSQKNRNASTADDHVLDAIHTSVVTGILNDGEEDHFAEQKSNPVVDAKPAAVTATVEKAVKPVVEEPRYELKGAPVKKESSETTTTKPGVKSAVVASSTVNPEPTPAPRQELAPWAVKQEQQKPSLTLKEIQSLEAERAEKQKAQLKLEQQQQQQQQSKAWASIEEPVIIERTALPKTSSWASNSAAASPVVTKKTLADIQREEAEAAAAAKLAGRSSAAQKNSFASAIVNPALPKEDLGAWTTVASKRTVVKKAQPVQQVITNSSAASKANPQLLRSVSATKTATSSVNDTALREEFLIWARSQMTNLYPSVSKDDLLDIFVTLPASSSDSSQLISETIYSSSATMDGRRFAQEFLKRRQKVDQQVSNQEEVAWSAAIISSANKVATVDEDGWSTSVKSKKKNVKKF